MKTLLAVIAFLIITGFCFLQPTLYLSKNEDGHFVEIRGKKQFVVVEGKGNPTVVFLAGKGRTLDDFIPVFNKIKKALKYLLTIERDLEIRNR
ncbi:MAG TPA: hypothetical protein VK835_13995 [Bacteroidia bacterium]|jgi:hypothetical protein|nr:hypothetical protein [Bacteroidia bacterium]